MTTKVVRQDGVAALLVDGRRTLPVMYGLSDLPGSRSGSHQAQKAIAAFGKAGVDIVCVDTWLGLGWRKTTPFDAEGLLAEVAYVRDANPRAKVVIRLHMNAPYWWMRDNPGECTVYRTPQGDHPGIDNGENDRLIKDDLSEHCRVSLASEKWRRDASAVLRQFCRILTKAPEGESVIGIQIACGVFGEWHQWGTDVGPAMTAYYHRYAGVSPTAAFCPENTAPTDRGVFRDPVVRRATVQSQMAVQDSTVTAILQFAQVLREEMPHIIVGCFYGYNNDTILDPVRVHLFPEKVYASGLIDFACGPFCYGPGRDTDGVPLQRAPLESLRLHGVLWMSEMDQHPIGIETCSGGDPAHLDETVSVLLRNTLQPLLAGVGFWYYDHRVLPGLADPRVVNPMATGIYRKESWWIRPELLDIVKTVQQIGKERCLCPRTSMADVLLVYDTKSYFYKSFTPDVTYRYNEALVRSGVIYDHIYIEDLERVDLSRYACVVMANTYVLTPQQRTRIRELLRDTAVLWYGPAGYCDTHTLSAENMGQTVGMTVAETDRPAADDALTPVFTVTDAQAEALTEGDTAFAFRKGNNIWFATLPDDRQLAPVLAACGAHIYTADRDPVFAGYGMLMLICPRGGTRRITLRSGRVIEETLPPYTTALYDAETGARVL